MKLTASDKLKWFKRDNKSGCWNWTGSKNTAGYGTFQTRETGERQTLAHRISFVFAGKKLRKGQCVLHKCDNRSCINPKHLYAGSRIDNARDLRERGGRKGICAVRGEEAGNAKLTESDVMKIRRSKKSHVVIAAQFGISRPHVSYIQTGKTWKHLPEIRKPIPLQIRSQMGADVMRRRATGLRRHGEI